MHSIPVPSTTLTRRSQEERSAQTRRRLLDAAVACLTEHGYRGTTTLAVAERAGVSRGARAYHFPTRADLVAAALDHLAQRRLAALGERLAALPQGPTRSRTALDALAGALSGPLYAAWLELVLAARSDPELRAALVPVERRVHAELHRLATDLAHGDTALADLTVAVLLGQGVAGLLRPPPAAARRASLDRWAELLARPW